MAGTSKKYKVFCRKYADSDKCPVKQAFILRRTFLQALANQSDFFYRQEDRTTNAIKLQNAKFLQQLCESVKKNKKSPIKEDDIVSRLRKANSYNHEAMSLNDSQLYQDIEYLEEKKKELIDEVERAAEKLSDMLRSPPFQNDLLKNHGELGGSYDFLSADEIAENYPEIEAEIRANVKIRTLDHIAALLTENLAVSEKGRELLSDLLDERKLSNLPAFDAVWGLITKGKDTIEKNAGAAGQYVIAYHAFGSFLQNAIPVIDYNIKKGLRKGTLKTIDNAFSSNSPIMKTLDFLDKKFGGIKVSEWIKEHTQDLATTIDDSVKKIELEHESWQQLNDALDKKSYDTFDDFKNDKSIKKAAEVHEHIKKLDSAYIAFAFDSISLFISCIKIAQEFKKLSWKDGLSALNDLLGITKTAIETYESAMAVNASRFTGKSSRLYTRSALRAKGAAKVLGVAGAIISTIISVIDFVDGFQRGDREAMGLAAAGVVCGIGTGIAIFAASAIWTGIFAAVGILVAIAAMIWLDPPILDYFELVYWSVGYFELSDSKRIAIEDTSDKFYSTVFKLEIKYFADENDKDYNRIEIRSGMISDEMPMFIEVVERGEPFKNKVRFYSKDKSIDGKGAVLKEYHLHIDNGVSMH
ncbi:MAG: hypothetical protein GF398_08340, partial [Chitinivibrionales bacterium]|nr:hypothetical protein [Chitinivibrionales bacterium]